MIGRMREVYVYRAMLWSLVLSELRTRYKGSALGFLWTFISPLLTLIVYDLVFSTIMHVKIPHFAVFLFIGLLGWNMFATAVQSSTGVIVRQSSLVKKIYFPREILPLSVVGGSVINYLLSLLILFPFMMLSGFVPSWLWAYMPAIVLMEAILTAGFSLMFAAINVYLRDLEHMLGVFLLMWFYLTPVVYSLSMIPHKYAELFKFNPVSAAIISYQDILYFNEPVHWKLFLYGYAVSIIIFLLGMRIFGKLNRRFAEEV